MEVFAPGWRRSSVNWGLRVGLDACLATTHLLLHLRRRRMAEKYLKVREVRTGDERWALFYLIG